MFGRFAALAVALGLGAALALGVAGCTPGLCGRSSDCSSGHVCTSVGACVVPPADAGVDDGPAAGDETTVTPIRDADGDAFDIEPIDAAPPIDVNMDLIDAPDDDGVAGADLGT